MIRVIRRIGTDKHWNTKVLAECYCGNLWIVREKSLRNGNTKSCGCYRRENSRESILRVSKLNLTHGEAKRNRTTSNYTRWRNMLQRCNNPKSPAYKDYGGRGIKVCSKWQHSFKAFLKDMGNRPSSKYSIDRINNNGDYMPSNCRWATQRQQSLNTRRTA